MNSDVTPPAKYSGVLIITGRAAILERFWVMQFKSSGLAACLHNAIRERLAPLRRNLASSQIPAASWNRLIYLPQVNSRAAPAPSAHSRTPVATARIAAATASSFARKRRPPSELFASFAFPEGSTASRASAHRRRQKEGMRRS